MKILAQIREFKAKSPREKYLFIREMGTIFLKPFALNTYDPEFQLSWRSYICCGLIFVVLVCVLYDMAYRWTFELLEILQLVSFTGIAAHVSKITLKLSSEGT